MSIVELDDMDQTMLPVRPESDFPDTESIITSFEYDGADDFVSDMEEASKTTTESLQVDRNAFNTQRRKSTGKMVAVEFDMSE